MSKNDTTTTEYQNYLALRHGGAQNRRTAEVHGAFILQHLKPGMRLLDVGCGPGAITLGLAQRVAPADVVGVDINSERIEQARSLAANAGSKTCASRRPISTPCRSRTHRSTPSSRTPSTSICMTRSPPCASNGASSSPAA